MNTIFDDFTREIARGITRRDALRRMGGVVAGMMLGTFGLKKAHAATTLTCGTCQACNLDTNVCGTTCTPATAGQTLCTMAGTDGSYLRLLNYLTTNGFTVSGVSSSVQLFQGGSPVQISLTTDLAKSSGSGEAAAITYAVTPQGSITAFALVSKAGLALYTLSVDSNGTIVLTIATQNLSVSGNLKGTQLLHPSASEAKTTQALGATNRVTPLSESTVNPEPLALSPTLCEHLLSDLCALVVGGDCAIILGAFCAAEALLTLLFTAPVCYAALYAICTVGYNEICQAADSAIKDICNCPLNSQYCNGICCGPCQDCSASGACIPAQNSIFCPDLCCNGQCCAVGQTCVNNVCTNPNTGCYGATCATYSSCNGDSACFCGTIEGGTLCQTSISCSGLATCSNGTCADANSVCLYGSCCDEPVCVPLSVECPATVSAVRPAVQRPTGPQTGPWTGHR